MSDKKAAYILDGDVKIPINDPSVPEWAKQQDINTVRTNLSIPAFVNGEFATVGDFWDAVTASGNYNKVFTASVRFKDTSGWGPLGNANIWYQGIVTWQNPPTTANDVAGVAILWRGSTSPSTIYRGSINGNATDGIKVDGWWQVYDQGVTVPIANGGTGASTALGARSNLGLTPTQLYKGSLTSGSTNFTYGDHSFYLIVIRVSTLARTTVIVPATQIVASALDWRVAVGENTYFPFSLMQESSVATLTISEASKGSLLEIWGVN